MTSNKQRTNASRAERKVTSRVIAIRESEPSENNERGGETERRFRVHYREHIQRCYLEPMFLRNRFWMVNVSPKWFGSGTIRPIGDGSRPHEADGKLLQRYGKNDSSG